MTAIALAIGLLIAPQPAVRFYWCAQLATGTIAAPRYAIAGDGVLWLKTGDRLQFYLAPVNAVHAYLVHVQPDRQIDPFFPEAGGRASIAAGEPRYFPGRNGWFRVEKPPGQQLVILLVSAEPLTALEDALQRHARAVGADRKAASAAVLAEIGRLKREFPPPASRASRPTPIAGTFRSTAPDPATEAVELTAPRLYARTYVIDHK